MRKINPNLHPNMPLFGGRMPKAILSLIAELSRRERRTKSDMFRALVVEALDARGHIEAEVESA